MPDLVRATTRARVEAAARELGYRPNRAARGLITGAHGQPRADRPGPVEPVLRGGGEGRAGRGAGGGPLGVHTDEEPGVEVDLLRALAKQVDGLILCSPRAPDDELAGVDADTTLVLMNREAGERPSVTVDNADGMRQALEHLAALGHRRVAFVAGPRTSWSNAQRESGLHRSAEAGAIDLVHLGHFPPQFEGGVAAADLAVASGATAVIAYNDLVALGLLSRLGVRGIPVPSAMSVVGCDDIGMSAMSHPALTTVSVPKRAAGRATVGLLLSLLDAGPDAGPMHRQLPTQLIVRGTTGVAPAPQTKGSTP
jgi:DNA-binding LacI/PurR family transcriptional regulator